MASSFFLGVGLYVALFSGLSEGTAVNCTLQDGIIDVLRDGDFSSVSDVKFDGCKGVFELIEQLNNLTLASRSVTVSSLDEVLVHIEEMGNLTLNCSVTVPTNYRDVSISLMRDGKYVPTDKAWHGSTVVATNVINGTDGMRSRRFTIQHRVPNSLTGDFTCVMDAASSEGHHSVSWTIPVMVHDPLTVEVKKDVNITEYETVHILCTVTGNPIPDSVIWNMTNSSGVEVLLKIGTDNYQQTSEPEKEFRRVFTLAIDNATSDMNLTQYHCNAFDSVAKKPHYTSGTATLSVTKRAPTTTAPSPTTPGPVSIAGVAVAVVVLVVLCGAMYVVYWKRHMLRDWLMEKDVVKVIKKQKRAKGYKYSKLPKNISSSMKHLE